MRGITAATFALLFTSAGLCQTTASAPPSATPGPGAYPHVFSLRSPRHSIEYVPPIPSQGGWLSYLDDAYEQSALGYGSLAPWLGSLTRVFVLPVQIGDTNCAWEVKYALAPGVWSWWILLNPNAEVSERPVILRLAFAEMFAVASGQQPLRDWRLPACLDAGPRE